MIWHNTIGLFELRAFFSLFTLFCILSFNLIILTTEQYGPVVKRALDSGEDLGSIPGPCVFFIFLTFICRFYVYTFQAPTM